MLPYAVRKEIFRLYNEEELEPSEILERIEEQYPDIEVSDRSIYRHIKTPPKPRQPMPEPQPRVYLPPVYSLPSPIQAQPQTVDAEWWYTEQERKQIQPPRRSQRDLPLRDERGRFLPRGSESTAMARIEPQQAITVHREFNPYDTTPGLRALWDLLKWIGRKLFGEVNPARANNQRMLTAGSQPYPNHQNGLNSPKLYLEWNDPLIYGLNAQRVYGNNLIPYESDYHVCEYCGQLHLNGDSCPWNYYR